MASQDQHMGGCLCGAIRYRVLGAPTSGNICYCTQCRRQTGSPMPAFVTYPVSRFALLAGGPASYRASPKATRRFCAACGSALFWQRDGADELDIFLGSLDRPELMPKPPRQLWTEHRMPWLPEFPELESFRRGAGETQ